MTAKEKRKDYVGQIYSCFKGLIFIPLKSIYPRSLGILWVQLLFISIHSNAVMARDAHCSTQSAAP